MYKRAGIGHAAMLRKASNVEPLDGNVRQREILVRVSEMKKSLPAIIQRYVNLEA